MPPRSLAAALRRAVSRRDLRALSRAARGAGPADVAGAWALLPPLARVAAFRALDARAAAETFAALPREGRWLAYLSEVSEGAAPLLEGATRADARLLRRASAAERARMRAALT